MHSRIIQVETEPVPVNERLSSRDVENNRWFLRGVADYVMEDEDRNRSLKLFKMTLSRGEPYIKYFKNDQGEGFILQEGFKRNYFAEQYQKFVDALRELSDAVSLDRFANSSLDFPMYDLNVKYDNKYGIYIQNKENDLHTLNDFIRTAEMDKPYYFGGILDYHW